MDSKLYCIDKLNKSDYHKGFLQLLEQLTIVESNKITYKDFCKRHDENDSNIFVIRDTKMDQVIATGSIYIEKKFIHRLGLVGHIEDVVVLEKYRRFGLGKIIMLQLIEFAKSKGCYKIILNCSKNNIEFYKKYGFSENGIEMANYSNN